MTGRPPAAPIRVAPSAVRDVPVTSWPADDEHRGQRTPDRPAGAGQEDACHRRTRLRRTKRSEERSPRRIAQHRATSATFRSVPSCGCDPNVRSRGRSRGSPSRRTASRQATWRRAQRSLPGYLLAHSVRSYCWGAAIAAGEGWSFDRRILWTASLLHDVGLTTIPANASCFEVEGGRSARRFLERIGLPAADAARVETRDRAPHAAVGHAADGVEAVAARSCHRARRSRRRVRARRRHPARPSSVRSRGRHSTGCSSPRSRARRSVDRPARAPACCTTSGLAGWMAGSPWRTTRTRHAPG